MRGTEENQSWGAHLRAEAACRLGEMCLAVPEDETEIELAKIYFETAMDDGGVPAAYAGMGEMYEKGLGVEQDYKKAAELYQIGAGSEDKKSLLALARLYEEGKGVPQDTAKAAELKERAEKAQE